MLPEPALSDSAQLAEDLAANDEAARFVDPRTVPVRFTCLKQVARSALHYLDSVQRGYEETFASKLGAIVKGPAALHFGRVCHAMTFRKPVVKWTGKTRNGAVWNEFRKAHPDQEIANEKEWARAEEIAEALHTHPLAEPLLFHPESVHEQRIDWKWLGRSCRSTPDARHPGVIVELKTTKCAEPAKFERDAYWRNYHSQLAFYGLAYEYAFQYKPSRYYIVAVESERPHAVTVMEVPLTAIDMGERMCRSWMERLLVCEQSDSFPGYSESIVQMSMPDGADQTFTIDGEGIDF